MPDAAPTDRIQPSPVLAFPARNHPACCGCAPTPFTSCIGREREVASVRDLLVCPEVRLLTLTGPAGVGKTRLAIEVATTVRNAFADGVWFIPLASVRDPAHLAPAIAGALGVAESGDRWRLDRLADHLRGRETLLALENVEHLVEAAPDLLRLLGFCPRLKILATSRVILRVSGERDFPVSPLAAPDPASAPAAHLLGSPAARLFVERASALDPAFAAAGADAADIAAICRRLDGLPLAIELAAARGNLLSPRDLLARLERRLPLLTDGPRDAPARLRTMRDAIAWSHDLLSRDERRLFQRLSVFVGGFTLAAAAAVCPEWSDLDLLRGIGSLVDKSLARRDAGLPSDRPGGARFSMLETIREFASERLAAAAEQEAAARRLHAAWCLGFAERFWAEIIRGPVDPEQIRRVAVEHDNLRAALAWLRQTGDNEWLLRLAAAVWPFWLFGNHLSEGRFWLEAALTAAAAAPPMVRARALRGLGLLARLLGDNAQALTCLEQSLALARTIDDRGALGRSLHMLAMAQLGRGDSARARACWNEALPLFETLPDGEPWVALVRHHLGLAAFGEDDRDRAVALLETALAMHQDGDDRRGVASSLIALALVESERGNDARSAALYREGLTSWQALGMQEGLAAWLAGVATLAVARDRLIVAARLFGAADRLAEGVGVIFHLPERAAYERAQAIIRAAVGEANLATAWQTGRRQPWEQAMADAGALIAEADADASGAAPSASPGFGLTARERDVLRLLVTGRTDREIADELFVSARTIHSHVAHIRRKLEAASRTEAVAIALRHDLIASPASPNP